MSSGPKPKHSLLVHISARFALLTQHWTFLQCSSAIECFDQETTGLVSSSSRPILTLSTLLGRQSDDSVVNHAIVRLNVVHDLFNSEGWTGNLICCILGLYERQLCSNVTDHCLDQETTGLISSRPILTLSALLSGHG